MPRILYGARTCVNRLTVQNPMDFNGLKKETAKIVVQLRIGISEGEEESGIITLDSWDITLVP